MRCLFATSRQLPWFTKTKEFRDWAIGKAPETNIFAFLGFKKELDHATRLEF